MGNVEEAVAARPAVASRERAPALGRAGERSFWLLLLVCEAAWIVALVALVLHFV
jgi:hypothetical protein